MRFPYATAVKLLAFACCSLLVFSIMWNTLNNATNGSTLTYSARFADASGLRQGDSVRVAGVLIGKVEEIKIVDNSVAEVRFRVEEEHRLFSNTRVLIRYENLIGQRYLSLREGNGPADPLPDGARIDLGKTEPALDLSVLMNGFDPLFDVLSPDDINRLSTTIVKVLQGEGATLNDLLHEVGAISEDLADHDQVIGRVITNLAEVVTHLAKQDDQFSDLLVQARGLVDGLASNRSVLGSSMQSMDSLAAAMAGLFRDVRPSLHANLQRATTVLGIFARDRKSVGKVLSVTQDFFDRAAGPAQYGSWLALYPCELNVNVVGPESSLLNDLLLGHTHSEVCR